MYDYVLQRGNAIQQQAEKDKKIYNLLVLQTANNERAREFLMDDKAQLLAAGATLDRMTAFQRLENHFIPKITEAKSAAVKALSDAIDSCWGAEQTGVAAGLVKRQAAVRECGYLNCKPDEVIMITQFPKAIPDDERWGAKKSLWQEANIATIKDAIEKARVADMQIGSENQQFQISCRKATVQNHKKFHGGECRYKNKQRGVHRRNFNDSKKRCFICGKKGHISFN